MQPGWKSSEFWLTLAAQAAGAVLASGLPSDNKVVQVSALAMQALTLLGYQNTRARVKVNSVADALGPQRDLRGKK